MIDCKEMAIKVFFHICAITRAEEVVQNFIRSIHYSGLYDEAYAIYCYISGIEDIMRRVVTLIKESGRKFVIVKVAPHDSSYERLTLEDIHNHVDQTDKILYIHSKGVTFYYQDKPALLQNIDDWANTMLYFLVRHYKKCLERLDHYDTVGVNLGNKDGKYHWSGNFWWVRGDYFLTLPHHIGPNYLDPELNFVFLNTPRYFEIYRMSGIKDCYYERYEPYKYIDTDLSPTIDCIEQ